MKHAHYIQDSIQYIEAHLHESLTLEKIANQVGFAPTYFHQLFKREIGTGIAEYIRQRRLCQAALMLMYTGQGILDIALKCGFESQEAFTRAFKKEYSLPPGRYRKLFDADQITTHPKGEYTMTTNTISSLVSESPIQGWFLSGTHMPYYAIQLDYKHIHQGQRSAHLYSVNDEALPPIPSHEQAFGTLMQQFQASAYRGKRVRFSGFIRTSQLELSCGLWMRVDDRYDNMLQFDNMSNRPITGDRDWNHYAIVLDIPPESTVIAFGIMLIGQGHVWADSLKFEEVGLDVPVTHMDAEADLPQQPQNLNFEQ